MSSPGCGIRMDPSWLTLQMKHAENQDSQVLGTSTLEGTPNIPDDRPQILGIPAPNPGQQNPTCIAAGRSIQITHAASVTAGSTPMLNSMHENIIPHVAPSVFMNHTAGQLAGPSIRPFINLPAGCSKVPIGIWVLNKRPAGRHTVPQTQVSQDVMMAPDLAKGSQDSANGTSVQLASNNLLSLGGASNIVASNKSLPPLTPANIDKYKPVNAPFQQNLGTEASKAGTETEASRWQQSATAVIKNCCSEAASISPKMARKVQGQHPQESNILVGEGSAEGNMQKYQMQKQNKTQINHSNNPALSIPNIYKECTPTQPETHILDAEQIETIKNENETPGQRPKPRKKKHRPKVIREGRPAKAQNSAVATPKVKPPNPTVKRTYVRKKRSLSSLENSPVSVGDKSISSGECMTAEGRTARIASVRRRLQFELEEQAVGGDQSSMATKRHHYQEKLPHPQGPNCSVTKSTVQVGQGLQMDVDNSPEGLVFGLSHKLNENSPGLYPHPQAPPQASVCISSTMLMENSREPPREQDNRSGTCYLDTTRKSVLQIEERLGMTFMRGNKLELNSSDVDGLQIYCSARSLSEAESTKSQMIKADKVEKWNREEHNNGEFTSTGTQDSILRNTAKMLAFCQSGEIKKKRSVRCRRLSFVPIKDLKNNIPQAPQRSSLSCMQALLESSHIKFMTKKRSQKAQLHSPSWFEPNMKHKNRISTKNIFSGESNGSSTSDGTFQRTLPWTLIGYIPDNKSINVDICPEVPKRSLANTSTTAAYMDPLPSVAWKLRYLDLNTEQVHRTEMHLSIAASPTVSSRKTANMPNALVPYGGRMVIPYERPWHLAKKQRPRAMVDLDVETTRVWKLLMGKAAEPVDGSDAEKEKWWQQEREVFQGRANSFIARMRLVQGDRHFSPWKGSVVDSVVGVFLTQNVADHLSSSAFMALAASFPPWSKNNNSKDDENSKDKEDITSTNAVQDKSMLHFCNDSVRLDVDMNCEDLSEIIENVHTDPKNNTSANELIKGDNYYLYDKASNERLCNHQRTRITPEIQQFAENSSLELAASNKEAQEIQFHEDIDSSQDILTSEAILQSRVSVSYGKDYAPGNIVGDLGIAASQELGCNLNDGKSSAGKNTAMDEVECQRIGMAARTDDVGQPGISSRSTIHQNILDVYYPQLDVQNELYVSSTSLCSSSGLSVNKNNDVMKKGNSLFMPLGAHTIQNNDSNTVDGTLNFSETSAELPVKLDHNKRTGWETPDLKEHISFSATDGMIAEMPPKANKPSLKYGVSSHNEAPDTAAYTPKPKKTTSANKTTENFDWDSLRRQAFSNGYTKERSSERRDSIDWEAVRCADVQRISNVIRERGMNNVLAARIQNFLNRLVRDHGSIDLEWLRDIPPDSAKDYLLSIRGLGLKSVECVRLLTLHHLAFPVDTNVGRICVRLGWVPIQPLPESLQLHLLELYPVQETIQKYLWPRLCLLDQQTLYELHYQMITFGKVFCTKSKPNCNACPMRSECKHFASAFASARLALPAPQDKSLVTSINQFTFQNAGIPTLNSTPLPQLVGRIHTRDLLADNLGPIIEEPASPRKEESPGTLKNEIEDFYEDPDEIPTIKLNMEAFAQNLEDCIKEKNKDIQTNDIAKALVAISSEAASIPVPKLKNVNRLRTEHFVYELPDSHPLVWQLELNQRERNDPSPYLLIIRMPDEIKESSKAPLSCCSFQVEDDLCNNEMCHACASERENQSRYVRGTILVPCRTAMRGSFPLNGTYFQVNEVFADHNSSYNPIFVPREQLWNLRRRMVYFGTSVPTIFKGLTTEEIQQCFWKGFVCVRGFDRETRAPKPLCPHLHLAASKLPRSRKTAAGGQQR